MTGLDLPQTEQGVTTALMALVGPRDVGKTTMAAALAPQLAPKDRIIAAGPVPTIAERIGVPWHKISRLQKKEADEFFESLERSDASFLLVLDEADSFLGASQFYSQPLQEWVRDNRNFGQGGVFIGHSVGEVNKSYLNNCDVIFFFRSSVPGTRDWLRKYARSDLADIDELVANLGDHQALVWAPKNDPKALGIARYDPDSGEIKIATLQEIEAEVRKSPESETQTGTGERSATAFPRSTVEPAKPGTVVPGATR